MPDLGRLYFTLKNGNERFHKDGVPVGPSLLEFWRWSTSDLVSNATRGVLAEFLVAKALDMPLTQPRDEWGAYDLETPDGIRIEVKSAAYLQSWSQARLSTITFSVRKTLGWSADTGEYEEVPRRKADVYVFALLAHTDKNTVDPLDLGQWQFYVLPTSTLNTRTRSQHSITLPSLQRICGRSCAFSDLAMAVREAGGKGS